MIAIWDWSGTLVKNNAPILGAEEILKKVAPLVTKQMILTNAPGAYVRFLVNKWGWDKYISKVKGQESGFLKPDKNAIFNILKDDNIESYQDVIMIGDSDDDKQCAINAECRYYIAEGGNLESISEEIIGLFTH